MVVLAFLVTALVFLFTPYTVIGSVEILNPGNVDQYDASIQMHKRYLGSLAKNKQLPSVQQRSYFVPPLISPYGKGQVPTFVEEEKRYLGALARTGDLNFSRPQHKRPSYDPLESNDPVPSPLTPLKDSRDDSADPRIMKKEMIDHLRPVILEYLKKHKKVYDPLKIELFLQNWAKAVFEKNEEITMDDIERLMRSDYFQPEENEDAVNESSKRNLQSLVREQNISYSGTTHPEPQPQSDQHRQHVRFDSDQENEPRKRNLGSVMKNKFIYRYPNYGFLRVLGKRDDVEDFDYSHAYDSLYTNSPVKRYTMYDINEPDITFEYPSQTGEQADYTDYAEQDAPISIGKRYLGALARNGWLPQGFAARSNSLSPGSFEKKHIGALARARGGWLSPVNTMNSPVYFSSNTQHGQGYKFRPPLFRDPRASFLKSKPQEDEPCKCKRSVDDTSGTAAFPGPNFRRLGRNTPSSTSETTRLLPTRSGPELLNKRFPMLMNVIDHYFFRKLYPDRLLRTSYNGFDTEQNADAACEDDSRNCYVNRLQMQKFGQ